jgi:hypothetical protein
MTARAAAISASVSTESASAARQAPPLAPSRAALWGGRISSGLAVLFLTFDAGFKLFASLEALESGPDLGWTVQSVRVLGWIQLVCLAAYLVPRTRVLGALLWTGYLGGAVATHLRVANPLLSHTLFPIYIATLLWLGLWLCDLRVRALLPVTR